MKNIAIIKRGEKTICLDENNNEVELIKTNPDLYPLGKGITLEFEDVYVTDNEYLGNDLSQTTRPEK